MWSPAPICDMPARPGDRYRRRWCVPSLEVWGVPVGGQFFVDSLRTQPLWQGVLWQWWLQIESLRQSLWACLLSCWVLRCSDRGPPGQLAQAAQETPEQKAETVGHEKTERCHAAGLAGGRCSRGEAPKLLGRVQRVSSPCSSGGVPWEPGVLLCPES